MNFKDENESIWPQKVKSKTSKVSIPREILCQRDQNQSMQSLEPYQQG